MKTLKLAILLVLATSFGCATARTTSRQAAVISHTALALLQDSEDLLVCGKPGAPPIPACIPVATHKQLISPKFVDAFLLHRDYTRLVLALPAGAPSTPQILDLAVRITALVNDIMALIPDSPPKEKMRTAVGL